MLRDPRSGKVEAFLDRPHGERFKGLNDLVFARNGDLYFTDQGESGLHDPTGRVYRLRADGRLELLLRNVPSPNGLVLTPNEDVLYLTVTRNNAVWRVPLLADGNLGRVGIFIQLSGGMGRTAWQWTRRAALPSAMSGWAQFGCSAAWAGRSLKYSPAPASARPTPPMAGLSERCSTSPKAKPARSFRPGWRCRARKCIRIRDDICWKLAYGQHSAELLTRRDGSAEPDPSRDVHRRPPEKRTDDRCRGFWGQDQGPQRTGADRLRRRVVVRQYRIWPRGARRSGGAGNARPRLLPYLRVAFERADHPARRSRAEPVSRESGRGASVEGVLRHIGVGRQRH